MSTVKYTKDHEWVRVEGDTVVVGITDYAQSQLGDVVYVELPEIGRTRRRRARRRRWSNRSRRRARSIAPVSGEVDRGQRRALPASPARVNSDPMGEGWFFKLRIADRQGARRADGRGGLSGISSKGLH